MPDITPDWEFGDQPDWARTLISYLVSGQNWPKGSESQLRELSRLYAEVQEVLTEAAEAGGGAYSVIRAGWEAPAALQFDQISDQLFSGYDSRVMALADNAYQYSSQASTFALETEYTKMSINIAFWIAVSAMFISVLASFVLTGGFAAPAAAAAVITALRTAIQSLLGKLALIAARNLTIKATAKLSLQAVNVVTRDMARTLAKQAGTAARTAVKGAPGTSTKAPVKGIAQKLRDVPGQMKETVTTATGRKAIGKELVEEISEETFIDAATQHAQMVKGTRESWDWKKTQASAVGAAGGAVVGTLAGPLSAVLPVGKPIRVGLNNALASPAGSFLANGVVYDKWSNPFSTSSVFGGFMGGMGRFYGNSPFDPNTYTQFVTGTRPADPAEGIPLPYPADGGNGTGTGPSGGNGTGPSGGNGNPNPNPNPNQAGQAAAAQARQPTPAAGVCPSDRTVA